jgi:RNA polymerase sigma-70 factor, ECF subfamily
MPGCSGAAIGRSVSVTEAADELGSVIRTTEAIAALPMLEFQDFYDMEQAGLFGAMCLITGNRSDAEDLTQEAFLKVWERWERVRSMERPSGYLYRTAMNAFRMRRRRARVAMKWLTERMAGAEETEMSLAKHTVDRGLGRLTPRQRVAVVLTELLGFSSGEAAELMHVKPATVRKLASQGRESLRGAIGGFYE